MAIMSRQPLSGSTNGTGITISSSQPGTAIHTVSSATYINDTVYLWAGNLSTTEARFIELWERYGRKPWYGPAPAIGLQDTDVGVGTWGMSRDLELEQE